MAHDPDGEFTQEVIVFVRKCLGRSYNDTLSCMDSERVEVLHVADRYTVVVFVPDYLILNLFPALERFLDKYLRRE